MKFMKILNIILINYYVGRLHHKLSVLDLQHHRKTLFPFTLTISLKGIHHIHTTPFCSSQLALVLDVLIPYSVCDSDMTTFFYDCLIVPCSDSRGMEKVAGNHGEESLSSVTLRISFPHVKIDNHQNLMGSEERWKEKQKQKDRKKQTKKSSTKIFFQEDDIRYTVDSIYDSR